MFSLKKNKNTKEENKMFENYRVFSTTLAGRKLTVETGKIAQLARDGQISRECADDITSSLEKAEN
jgi:hypothetical protein